MGSEVWVSIDAEKLYEEAKRILLNRFCNFCRKSQREVKYLIASGEPGDPRAAHICEECVAISAEIIKEEDKKKAKAPCP